MHPDSTATNYSSAVIQLKVTKARERQRKRWNNYNQEYPTNGIVPSIYLKKEVQLTKECRSFLKKAYSKLNLTARSHDKVLRIALTIADLDNSNQISIDHISEAIQYRILDRLWSGPE